MKVLTVAALTCLIGALLVEAAPALRTDPAANLVTNGSFEDGPAFEVCKPLDKDATDLKGWVVTRGQIDLCQEKDGNWKAADGKRSLDLHGSPGFGGVKQTLNTRAGKKYRVTFQMTGNPQANLTEARLTVRAAGADKEFGGHGRGDPRGPEVDEDVVGVHGHGQGDGAGDPHGHAGHVERFRRADGGRREGGGGRLTGPGRESFVRP